MEGIIRIMLITVGLLLVNERSALAQLPGRCEDPAPECRMYNDGYTYIKENQTCVYAENVACFFGTDLNAFGTIEDCHQICRDKDPMYLGNLQRASSDVVKTGGVMPPASRRVYKMSPGSGIPDFFYPREQRSQQQFPNVNIRDMPSLGQFGSLLRSVLNRLGKLACNETAPYICPDGYKVQRVIARHCK